MEVSDLAGSKPLMIFLLTSVLVVGGYSFTEMGGDQQVEQEPKVALIILDGADWKPINQLKEQDRLPHFSEMMEEGVYGNISTPKAFSPITWTKIATGHKADRINIKGWNTRDEKGYRRMVQSSDVERKRVWDYLNEGNVSTGVTGYFLTWPVEPVDGFMVSGALAVNNQELIYPKGKFNRSVVETGDEWEVADMVLDEAKNDYRFHTLGFKRLDGVQHALWKFIVPEKFGIERSPENDKYREVIYTEYENLDRVISRFDESWNVMVVSDSGFKAEGGYSVKNLEEFHSAKQSGYVYPTYEGNLNPLLKELGYANYSTANVLGERVRRYNPGTKLRWCSIDYPRPDYLNATSYIYRLCIKDDELDVQEAMDRLEKVKYRNGKPFFTEVRYDREKNSITGKWRLYESGVNRTVVERTYSHQPTFNGKTFEVDKALGLRLPDGSPFDLWIGPEKSGDHPAHTDGIFLARGPAFTDYGQINDGNVRAVDIAPTVLYMYRLPIPREMEGRPVTELFNKEFNSRRTITYTNASTFDEEHQDLAKTDKKRKKALEERLRSLGYLN